MVDRKGGLRWIDRDDRLARQVGFAVIERPVVAPCHTPLHAAVGTKCGRRDRFFLSVEDGRDFIEKFEIVLRDLESGRTLGTGFLH